LGEPDSDDTAGSAKSRMPTDRLFRNDLVVSEDGAGSLNFTDITEQAGIVGDGYGLGVAAGDINNDGWIDLFVANFGTNQLLLNNGNGTFSDVSERIPHDLGRWSTSAALVDYDRDGWLDLFICNYTVFNLAISKTCYAPGGSLDYCGPQVYTPEKDRLLRNRGDGTFEDVSGISNIGREDGPALGVVCADYDGDGWIDIYVANDGADNHLWMNQQDGRFRNMAHISGCACNNAGLAEASMGVDAADFDADGDEDLFMTHLRNEKNTLYVNDGNGLFSDLTAQMGLDSPSRQYTSFGTAWLDYDNDSWLDLFIANGAVKQVESLALQGDPYPYHQPNQLFRNLGDGKFEETTSGDAFTVSEVSRGAAFGDVDNDGDTDVLVLNNNGRARLLLNGVGNRQSWMGLRIVDASGKRDMLGARVAVHRPGHPTIWRRVRADASYCAANDPRVLVGLGNATEIAAVEVHWPDGSREQWTDLPVKEYTTIRQGTGTPRVADAQTGTH
ncbi:MAG: CRTAC1 family protein, partial [Planctomycetaceae bacterium]